MRDFYDMPEFLEGIKLQKLEVDIKKVISEQVLLGLDPHIDIIKDWVHKEIIVKFRTYVWSEQLQKEKQTVSYPKNAWQHFKQDFFLSGLKRDFLLNLPI